MNRVLVLGAGKIGALISGLLAESQSYQVDVGDVSETTAAAVVKAHGLPGLRSFGLDAAQKPVLFNVFFELGSFDIDRNTLAELKPGAVLALARPLEEGLDIIIGGVRIGRGELTTIGDSHGIRVTRI